MAKDDIFSVQFWPASYHIFAQSYPFGWYTFRFIYGWQTWGVSSWPPEQTFLFVHIFRSQMLFWISVMEWWDLLSCFECRMKKKPRQIYRISLSLESTTQISVPFFFLSTSKQQQKVDGWLFKTSFTKKFAVLIYLWSYFDYAWYNDEIDLLGLKEQGFTTDAQNLFSLHNFVQKYQFD